MNDTLKERIISEVQSDNFINIVAEILSSGAEVVVSTYTDDNRKQTYIETYACKRKLKYKSNNIYQN